VSIDPRWIVASAAVDRAALAALCAGEGTGQFSLVLSDGYSVPTLGSGILASRLACRATGAGCTPLRWGAEVASVSSLRQNHEPRLPKPWF
jgi:hypothetical protein